LKNTNETHDTLFAVSGMKAKLTSTHSLRKRFERGRSDCDLRLYTAKPNLIGCKTHRWLVEWGGLVAKLDGICISDCYV